MMVRERKPVVYVFHGDDELAISESIAELKSRLGEPSMIELNLTTLDGRSFSIEEFETAGKSLPFLAERRLAVLNHPLAYMQNDSNRKRILSFLEDLPEENAVVLAEYRPLLSAKERRDGKTHWLEEWGKKLGDRFYIREYRLSRGSQMTGWILKRAKKNGGEFEPQAAVLLASLLGDDVRLVDQEITKLLTYVNYDRPVEEADVRQLTSDLLEGGIFEFVDALGNRDRKEAVNEYHRLLSDQDAQRLFGMILRQFRLLLLTREMLDQNTGKKDITRRLKIHPFVGDKIAFQARQFSQSQLDQIYHRLLEIDSDQKFGVMNIDLSIDLMIAEIT
jgi:DNA polymerase-3 subunit delta